MGYSMDKKKKKKSLWQSFTEGFKPQHERLGIAEAAPNYTKAYGEPVGKKRKKRKSSY